MTFFTRLVLSGLTGVAFGAAAPARAQSKNLLQAFKDAYNQSQQQDGPQQQRQQQGQSRGGQLIAQSTKSAQVSNDGGDCCSPEALKKVAASSQFVDIVGIKLGMTPEQAIAAIKAHKAGLKIEVLNTRLVHPGSTEFVRVPRYISAQEPQSPKGYEYITVEFTLPPSPRLVSRVFRFVQMPVNQPVMASTITQSLRKKYGQENLTSNGPTAWVYDLDGKLPTSLPTAVMYCTSSAQELPRGTGQPQADYGQVSVENTTPPVAGASNNVNSPGCIPYVVVVAANIGEGVSPNTQLAQLSMTLQSGALVYNSNRATHDWLKAEADRKAKQQEDAAKARSGPKL
jgi:hypothetical protein